MTKFQKRTGVDTVALRNNALEILIALHEDGKISSSMYECLRDAIELTEAEAREEIQKEPASATPADLTEN